MEGFKDPILAAAPTEPPESLNKLALSIHQVSAGDPPLAQELAARDDVNERRDLAIHYDPDHHAALGSGLLSKEPTAIAQGLLQRRALTLVEPEKQDAAAAALANSSSFNISDHRIDQLPGLDQESEEVLKSTQRIQNISTKPEDVEHTLNAGFASAAQIASLSKKDFVKAVPQISEETAQKIHDNAVGVTQRNELFLASVASSRMSEVPHVLGAASSETINLDTLFGNQVSTSCGDCGSVLSPSAYLVDLIDFLPSPARDVFESRRADILKLELSCANANTELPYIDLVNEAMESYIGLKEFSDLHPTKPKSPVIQTFNNSESDESSRLIAEPRQLDEIADLAYSRLADQVVPIGVLPFDRSLEQSRIILGKLGSTREEILRTFGSATQGGARALSAEIVGISEAEYVALTGESFDSKKIVTAKADHEYWGFESQIDMLDDYDGISRVKTQFLPKTGYSYTELITLLQTVFVRGNIPPDVFDMPDRLDSLWGLVDWSKPDKDIAGKWDKLLSLKGVSPNKAAVIKHFPNLPNVPVISQVTNVRLSTTPGPPPEDKLRRYPLTGPVYYGPEGLKFNDSTLVGQLEVNGHVYTATSLETAADLVGYFDDRGVFMWRNEKGPEDYSGDESAYGNPRFLDEDNFFWVKYGKDETLLTAKLLRHSINGINGEMTITGRGSHSLALGPLSASPIAGWCWDPQPADGEPDVDLMAIRTLSGQPLSVDQWARIGSFVRLQKRLGWSIEETDQVLCGLSATSITADVIESLANVSEIQRLLSLELPQALVLTGDVTTDLYETMFLELYTTLFLRSTVVDADSVFNLDVTGSPKFTSVSPPAQLKDHVSAVGSAFGVSASDITVIIDVLMKASWQKQSSIDLTTLSVSSIATVYRYTILCQALAQKVDQLQHLLTVFGSDPFATPNITIQFLRFWKEIFRQYGAGILPSDIDFIASGEGTIKATLPFATLLQVSYSLHKLQIEAAPAGSVTVQRALGTPVVADDKSLEHSITSALTALFPQLSADIVGLIFGKSLPKYLGPEETKIDPFSGYFIPSSTAQYVISEDKKIAQSNLAKETTDDRPDPNVPLETSIQLDEADSLVGGQFYKVSGTNLCQSVNGGTTTLIPQSALLSQDLVTKVKAVLTLLSRYNALIAASGTTGDDAERLLRFKRLPGLDAAKGACLTSSDIDELLSYGRVRDIVSDGKALHYLLECNISLSVDGAAAHIAIVSGWTEAFAKTLVLSTQTGVPDLTTKVTIDLTLLDKIRTISILCQRLKISDATILSSWASPTASSQDIATEIRNVARGQVDEATWDSSAAALFDPLRRSCRNALIAECLKLVPDAADADDLFKFFLMDVSMGSCLKTSRMRQAISSIQIFVQRCFLGLEKGVSAADFDEDHMLEWKWKQAFDTWVANRKILLYPENWLEPSLRDNKTETFSDIESSLQQDHLSSQDALIKYIAGMLETADLEPVQVYAGPARDHLIARTRMTPHKFFHRQFDRELDIWTPWESMHVEIPTIELQRTLVRPLPVTTGDANTKYSATQLTQRRTDYATQVAQVMKDYPNQSFGTGSYAHPITIGDDDDRLVLFIPTFAEKSYKHTDKTDDPRRLYYWDIGMSFSERKEGKWTPRKSAAETIDTRGSLSGLDPSPIIGFGARDIDEHLMNKGSFFFFPFREDSGIVGVKVCIVSFLLFGQAYMESLYLGDFVLDHGHCYMRTSISRGSTSNDSAVVYFGTFPGPWEWSFQGAFDQKAEPQTRTIRHFDAPEMWDSDNMKAGKILKTVDIIPKKSAGVMPNPVSGGSETADEWLLRQQWAKQAVAYPVASILNPSRLPVLLSNKFSSKFQDIINSGTKYSAVFSLFSSTDDWPLIQSSTNGTTVFHQGLGVADSEQMDKSWYHEQRTPISLDNWELSVHLPMLLASTYLSSQKLDEALEAVKFVFDPTATDKTQVWKFIPFRELVIKADFTLGTASEVNEWRRKPYNPFVVARGRPLAYMKWFAYKYIEIMIAKGDYYFRLFSLESISLAIQCYIEAGHVYGPAPQTIQSVGKRETQSYSTLRSGTTTNDTNDPFFNVLVNLETLFPFRNETATTPQIGTAKINLFGTATANYFCIPANPAMVQLRQKIDDRLYKIRNCQDIDGNPRTLSLWPPPLDPGAVVRAAAAGGGSGSSMVDGVSGSLPNYRFSYLIRLALEMATEVRMLGANILSLRDKRDAEQLSLLRLDQQKAVGQRLLELRAKELEEVQKTRDYLQGNRGTAEKRMQYFLSLLGQPSNKIPGKDAQNTGIPYSMEARDPSNPLSRYEKWEAELSLAGMVFNHFAGTEDILAGVLGALPSLTINEDPWGLGISLSFGGGELSSIPRAYSSYYRNIGDVYRWGSENASRQANIERQILDRQFQANQAGEEITGIDLQIAAQELRIDQVQKRLDMEQQGLDQDDEMDTYLRGKYSNTELITWSINSLYKLYYASYNMACEVALQAQKAFNFERGIPLDSADYIEGGGYWNGSQDGLYAGEQLGYALRRLQKAHIDNKPHDFEITRSVSLRLVNPAAVTSLRTLCDTQDVELPETLWDMDFPGQYNRRIKSVAVSIMCVTGPYASVNATLTLSNSSMRTVEIGPDFGRDGSQALPTQLSPITAVAVSSAQTESGVFEVNFHDERYMPFEGAGVISTWRLELPKKVRSFAYNTISDVVLHIRYTSQRADTASIRAANTAVDKYLTTVSGVSFDRGLALAIDPRVEFASAWAAFRVTGVLTLKNLNHRLPYFARAGTVAVKRVRLLMTYDKSKLTYDAATNALELEIGDKPETVTDFSLPAKSGDAVEEPLAAAVSWTSGSNADDWVLSVKLPANGPGSGGGEKGMAAVAKAFTGLQILVAYTLALPTAP